MFSEYASRFLAQSQSRLSFGQPDLDADLRPNRNPSDRRSSSRYATSRSFLQRQTMPSPYHPSASQTSKFPFGSRTLNPPPAPLFYSAADEFREENDGEEYEREVADLHALQKSRRTFGDSRLTESSEMEPEDRHVSDQGADDNRRETTSPRLGGAGVKNSWRGVRSNLRGRPMGQGSMLQTHNEQRDGSTAPSEGGAPHVKGRGNLVDVDLTSASEAERVDVHDEFAEETDDHPPSFQSFHGLPAQKPVRSPLKTTLPIPQETDEEALLAGPRPISPSEQASSPIAMDSPDAESHDPFWLQLFVICQCATLGASLLIFLQTSPPDSKRPLGDTIYTVLHKSFHLLAVYSLVSVIVGFLWLALLRSFIRPLIFLSLIAVPVILFSFFLYPFISSYRGSWGGSSFQDRAMWWLSFIPCAVAAFWTYTAWKGRHSLARATELLEFAGKILTAMSPLILVGIATLAAVIVYTWLWMLMFTRLFLEGHFSSGKRLFIIDLGTWWLAVGFVLNFLWTLGVFAGVQRATTAATVSQWYFHRNAVPRVPATIVVKASLWHAVMPMGGTICMSTFLSLMVRVPLLILPRRFVSVISLLIYAVVPTSIAALTNPLTLTYASVHSQALNPAARNLSQMTFVSKTRPTTTLNPGSFNSPTGSTLVPYRLAKLLLHALRFIMSLALGFGGWVSTARMLQVTDGSAGYRGSLYAYVIGIIAATIGWGALGAMEGIIGGILDALVVCWGSEVGVHGFGEVRYCREAGQLLGDGSHGRWS